MVDSMDTAGLLGREIIIKICIFFQNCTSLIGIIKSILWNAVTYALTMQVIFLKEKMYLFFLNSLIWLIFAVRRLIHLIMFEIRLHRRKINDFFWHCTQLTDNLNATATTILRCAWYFLPSKMKHFWCLNVINQMNVIPNFVSRFDSFSPKNYYIFYNNNKL